MILMNDFKAEPEELVQRQLAAVERVLRSGWYILGKEVKDFEAAWANCCGVAEAVGVANGMDAIEIGLRTLGIGAGDEVITTPMTAFATVLAIFRVGAQPVLADIDADTALSSMDSVARCISSKTKAVLLVHMYGQLSDMAKWQEFCRLQGILLLEDCAQAHLAQWSGNVAGSFGAYGAYSFYPTKNLGAIGDAGALVTNDFELAERARVIRNYGQSERYHHPELGLNSRLDELHAAMLTERLKWLDSFTVRRREVAEAYHANVKNPAITMLALPLQSKSHVYHLFVVRCEERDRLSKYLTAAGVANLAHYPIPAHQQRPCAEVRVDPNGLPAVEAHAKTCLSIPCHPQMTDDDVAKVVEVVNAFK
ncbi:pyridoxal-5'-phosphate-dependent protein [Herbaspirillum sp. meg3]|uniref:DegT/DnrJ/EryC1/StrS family aminotransferase n=1 Tax=Herbaspirillum sp. meg3 TaxID=2025949 RepID=UPI000B99CC8B|nr:DegT/DnrJ/EryC1/StrS family aminotransferase [Herbaspirillum sp. meg3]ASU40567.1 pyridoxal-5'-phosphate-dependent protein [Herbaspirillum sp. meg3]